MTVTVRERELTAVGISVAAGCKPCTDYHVKAARKARVSDDRIRRAITNALDMRRNATAIMSAYALAHVEEVPVRPAVAPGTRTDRVDTLVSMGAAFAVNCVSSLATYLRAAEEQRISQGDVRQVLKLATYIKGRAASHVERLAGMAEYAPGQHKAAAASDCGRSAMAKPHAWTEGSQR
jgi:AhpD family alkylhydroperoxidase